MTKSPVPAHIEIITRNLDTLAHAAAAALGGYPDAQGFLACRDTEHRDFTAEEARAFGAALQEIWRTQADLVGLILESTDDPNDAFSAMSDLINTGAGCTLGAIVHEVLYGALRTDEDRAEWNAHVARVQAAEEALEEQRTH